MFREFDFEKAKSWTLTLAGGLIIYALYVKPTLYGFVHIEPDSFQRAGSMLVAFAVVVFGISRANTRYLTRTVEEPTLPEVAELEVKLKRLGLELGGYKETLFKLNSEQHEKEYESVMNDYSRVQEDWLKAKSLKETLEANEEYVRGLANRLVEKSHRWELSALFVGTLQWGYGDLFVCWFHGNGWSSCS